MTSKFLIYYLLRPKRYLSQLFEHQLSYYDIIIKSKFNNFMIWLNHFFQIQLYNQWEILMSKNFSAFNKSSQKVIDKNTHHIHLSNQIQQQPNQHNFTSSFQGSPKYSLDHINSIFFKNGKIYNLLERNVQKRVIRCGCVKSFCEAKYCQCFRNGQACTEECLCKECRNKNARRVSESLQQGCKCRKSGCTKKYCECFQNGKKCGDHCQCINCQNGP